MARIGYLRSVIWKELRGGENSCPFCRSQRTITLGRKWVVLQLRQCRDCGLSFRYPKDDASDNVMYYTRHYRQDDGMTTRIPSDTELRAFLESGFCGTVKDFASRLELIKRYAPGGRALDFGASWGYGTYQLSRSGYAAVGFEIDSARARYGREKLGIEILTHRRELASLRGQCDLVLASHVLEHLPDLYTTFEDLRELLREGGLLAIFVPNCTGIEEPRVFASKKSFAFGEKHTIAFTDAFFRDALPGKGFRIEAIDVTPLGHTKASFIDGDELMVLATKHVSSRGNTSA